MKLALPKGATSQTILVFIQDSASATGAGKTGLAFNTAGLSAYYARPRANAAAITLATQTVTGAFSSGGFVEVDGTNLPGIYRLDIPDAALASGADSVVVMLKGAAGMVPLPLEIQLTDFNLNVATVTVGTNNDKTGYALTAGERDSVADALLDRANGVETGRTLRQSARLWNAAAAGKSSGAATTTFKLRDQADAKDRISATVDADGNRTAISVDLS